MAVFYTCVYRAIQICSDLTGLSNEFNYLKCLALFRGYNLSTTDKVLNKFKKTKRSAFHLDSCFNPVILIFYIFIIFSL